MIQVTVNLNGWDQKLSGADKRLRKFVYKRIQAKTKQLKLNAQKRAPKHTGALSKAIYGRAYEKPLKASIGIASTLKGPMGYPYANFVAGGQVLNIPRRQYNRYFRSGQKVAYGEPALTPSGNGVSWSAERGWWQIIAAEARRSYPQTVARAVKDFAREMNA
jgi:hypothetical protein